MFWFFYLLFAKIVFTMHLQFLLKFESLGMCVYTNHDITCLGVKVDQGLPSICYHIPRSSGKPL